MPISIQPKGKQNDIDDQSHGPFHLIIVDTLVWISFFNRHNAQERREVNRLIDAEEVVRVGIVLTELIEVTRSGKEKRLIRKAPMAFSYFKASKST